MLMYVIMRFLSLRDNFIVILIWIEQNHLWIICWYCRLSLLCEKVETFFLHTESTYFVRRLSQYETSGNNQKVSQNIHQMRIDPCDTRDTASYWPQGFANGHLFTHCLVENVYIELGFESLCKQIPKHLNERTILLAQ